jgi:dCTP deaminase
MSFWSDTRWRTKGRELQVVQPFEANKIQEAKYALSVGSEVVIRDGNSTDPVKFLAEVETITIHPGQFALILTEQVVAIPTNSVGFISIRASIKFYGLVNVSGFHVDPGYRSRLLFAVYHAGTQPITVRRGDDIFNIWLADLDTENQSAAAPGRFDRIPSETINKIAGTSLTPYELNKKLEELNTQVANHNQKSRNFEQALNALESDIKSYKYWLRALTIFAGVISLFFAISRGYDQISHLFSTNIQSETKIPSPTDAPETPQ